jgi:hypothetical protein
MPRLVRTCFLLAAAVVALFSGRAGHAAEPPDERCSDFLPAAERFYQIPTGLLTAIALTESGRGGEPDPWALNIGGQAQFAGSYAGAARLLRDRGGAPRLDAAVGCMQIYMRYHLPGIDSPEWALRPRNNVWYAAGFLRRLFEQYGDWRSAAAHYNASDPAAQRVYLCQVGRSLALAAPETAKTLALPQQCAADLPGIGMDRRILTGWTLARPPTPMPTPLAGMAGRIITIGPPRGRGVTILRGGPSAAAAAPGPSIIRVTASKTVRPAR